MSILSGWRYADRIAIRKGETQSKSRFQREPEAAFEAANKAR
jgi:hypothetical protein